VTLTDVTKFEALCDKRNRCIHAAQRADNAGFSQIHMRNARYFEELARNLSVKMALQEEPKWRLTK
jgi:hypothetical protein